MVALDHRANSCALIDSQRRYIVVAMAADSRSRRRQRHRKVYQLAATQLSDDGAAIPALHHALFSRTRRRATLNLGAHRKLFSYLTLFVEGAGSLALTSFTNSPSVPQAQQSCR